MNSDDEKFERFETVDATFGRGFGIQKMRK